MKELVHAIDTYVDIVDLKVTSNLLATEPNVLMKSSNSRLTIPLFNAYVLICFIFCLSDSLFYFFWSAHGHWVVVTKHWF